MSIITPRTLKGFRDYLPEAMVPREALIDTAKRVYQSYGFSPIDTPALEYLEILTGKGSEETDRQIYQFEDHGGRQVGMRFDLTVPLARFVAQHASQLGMPFKPYHIATVWRGENPQKGRYREFMQCDFDTIGTYSVAADIETGLVIHDLMSAVGFEDFTIRINNRMVLNGLLEKLGLAEQAVVVLRCLDKLGKQGPQTVHSELVEEAGVSRGSADQVLQLASLKGTNASILEQLAPLVAGNETGEAGVARLRAVIDGLEAAKVSEQRVQLDVSIARGLDYYTGVIFETFLGELPGIGSVCSGGRYDNLTGVYTKQQLPGIGASLGLDRLLAAMEELGKVETPPSAEVFIPFFAADRLNEYLGLAAVLRRAGFRVEVYPDNKKLGAQLKHADRRGFRVAVIAGEDEFAAAQCQIKNLETKESQTVSTDQEGQELVSALRTLLA